MKRKETLAKVLRRLKEAAKLVSLLVFLAVLMLLLSGALRTRIQPAPAALPPPAEGLETREVELRRFPLHIEQVGTIKTRNEAWISSRIMAQVVEVLVREGDEVSGAGESGEPTLLARLDDRDMQARLRRALAQQSVLEKSIETAEAHIEAARASRESAEANRVQAESDYRRYKALHEEKAATAQQLEQAKARWEIAEAQVRAAVQAVAAALSDQARIAAQGEDAAAAAAEARVFLSYARLQAPFRGRVARKLVEEGDMVSPGQMLFLVETPSRPELEAVVSESLLPHLAVGTRLDVRVDALDRTFEGTVREVVPRADPATRTVTVKVSLPAEPSLMSGLFGRLMIRTGEYDALVVPAAAVVTVGQLHLVRTIDPEGRLRRRFVTIGHGHGDVVEVLSGLREKEAVVVP